jgi:hypothetical protein
MLRIMSEQTLKIDRQKAFDRVYWNKLLQILKETGIDWRKTRLISNLYSTWLGVLKYD